METYIAALSMSMAAANVQNTLSVSMLKHSMDSAEESADIITEMLDENVPSPDGRGTLLNVLA